MNRILCILSLSLVLGFTVSAKPISNIIDAIKADPQFIDSEQIIGSETQKQTLKQLISFAETLSDFKKFVTERYPGNTWSEFEKGTKSISLTAEFLSGDDFVLIEETEKQLTYRNTENQVVKLEKSIDGLWTLDLSYVFGQVDIESLNFVTEMWIYFDSVLKAEMKRAVEYDYSFGLFTTVINIAGLASRPELVAEERKESIKKSIGRSLEEVRASYLKNIQQNNKGTFEP